jgi:flagellar motility protein MotE (MotC chaperone)
VANVNKFLQKFNQDLEEWSGKIATLENEIQLETQRNVDEKIKLCTEIDVRNFVRSGNLFSVFEKMISDMLSNLINV